MSQKIGKGLAKEDLLESLTEREVAGFAELLSSMRRPLDDNLHFLRSFTAKTLFGFLHRKLFGYWDSSSEAISKIVENLGEVRNFLMKVPIRSVHLKITSPTCPKMPYGLQIENKEAGIVFVTIHAWERFYERYCTELKNPEQKKIADRLQRSFARARRVYLGTYETLRIINNEFKPADYFLDQSLNCRFVVFQEKGGLKLLTTVERPYSR